MNSLFQEIADAIWRFDLIMWIMLAIAFIGTMFLVERFYTLKVKYNIDFNKFLNTLKKMIKAEDLDRAVNHCRNTKNNSLPLISLRAIEAAETDPATVKGTIEEEAIDFLPRIEERLNAIPALATMVLLVGILGSINALYAAFHSIDVLDTAQKQASIGTSIATSLSYTALGLVICMIFLMVHQYLKGVAVGLTERIHHGVAVLNNLLVPQDVTVMSVAGAGVMPQQDVGVMPAVETASSAADLADEPAVDSEADDDDDFDDASVEDIKDEEEII